MGETSVIKPVGARVAVTCVSDAPDAVIDPRFGRCQYFMILGPDGGIEVVPNTAKDLGNGAGIQAAQEMIDRKVEAVITGDVGPNAYRVLSAAGIDVYVGCGGAAKDAIERYRRGDLAQATAATSPGHHGMGRGSRRSMP
jgi:predicted Fe-Mo cluster-binding NifX family protein